MEALGILCSMFPPGPHLGAWDAERKQFPPSAGLCDPKANTGNFGKECGPELNLKRQTVLAQGRERHSRRWKSMSKDVEM